MDRYYVVFLISAAIVGLIFLFNKNDNLVKETLKKSAASKMIAFDSSPDLPVGFGYKTQWIAVKTSDTKSVVDSISLTDVHEANWRTGFAGTGSGYYFVSPPVQGWTLIINPLMPDLGAEISSDPLSFPLKAISYLSQRFGEAYYFGNHRIVGYYSWAKASKGIVERAFGYLGESGTIMLDQGVPTDEETSLNLVFSNLTINDGMKHPDEEDVLSIAKQWTIDPRMTEGEYNLGVGYSGKLNKHLGG
ncbi:hypothetical protein D7Z26_00330 [Cohnella endophytica]|uniref:Uncharacterized protein n=1 Tax=Cohnella endophytica TaxID=2419778 RepID=A0A494YBH6_9BACL|nr:hypothetical protein [Cohnella endophytica]RKP57996.1 hypothetical protein D7Z26_00330 [Cohnella endophytica]